MKIGTVNIGDQSRISSEIKCLFLQKNTFQISAFTESIDILFSCDWHIVWVDFLQKYTHSYEILSRPVKTGKRR